MNIDVNHYEGGCSGSFGYESGRQNQLNPQHRDSDKMIVIDNSSRHRPKKEQLAGKRTKLAKSPLTKIALQDMGEEETWNHATENVKPIHKRFSSSKILKLVLLAALALAIIGYAFFNVRPLFQGRAGEAMGRGTQAPSDVTEAQGLVIRGQGGGHVWIGERKGVLSIELSDKEGRPRVLLTLSHSGEPNFTLFDKNLKPQIELSLEPDMRSPIKLKDRTDSPALRSNEITISDGISPTEPATYVGAKTSNKYHYLHCKWARLIGPKGQLIFRSAKEARQKGYNPCPTCKPPPNDPSE